MKKFLAILVLGLLFCNYSNAVPSWLGKAFELCKVNQDISFYKGWKKDENSKSWNLELVNLSKGQFLTIHKSKGGRKFYLSSGAEFPLKNDDWDRVTMRNKYKGLKIADIVDCHKHKAKTKKISYDTYHIFTQNDLFNGLEDNKKIKGKGDLEFPTNKECKGIKKFPLMFLIHHSGGDIMIEYKYILHKMCVATFEPYIFKARGYDSNMYDTTKDVVWITEQAGALDSFIALDVVSKNKKINASKIGIMGWSYGGTVTIEVQNNFNIDLIKPKNKFALHLALYPYCFSYENSKTTDAPLFIFMAVNNVSYL